MVVHGGPASAHRSAWPVSPGVLASQGYYVFLPNPRGSYGQGEAFTRGKIKDFGYGDLRDILAGVEAVVGSDAPVDSGKVGLYGWSYGGYMARAGRVPDQDRLDRTRCATVPIGDRGVAAVVDDERRTAVPRPTRGRYES